MIAPTLRSRLGQPSRRYPTLPAGIPGAVNELSTVEWQIAHWMPIDFRLLLFPSKKPVRPTTAFNFSKARVVAGSSRLTRPDFNRFARSGGTASASTFSPTERAVFGLTPGPTPP